MDRKLYLVAYDIRNPKRLRRCLCILKEFSCGGQKSVFECFLSVSEKSELVERVTAEMDIDCDRLLIVPLVRENIRTMGKAVKPTDEHFFLVSE